MEIERKFLVRELPKDISTHEHFRIEQGYLCRKPVIRVRRFGNDYILTIKGEGLEGPRGVRIGDRKVTDVFEKIALDEIAKGETVLARGKKSFKKLIVKE